MNSADFWNTIVDKNNTTYDEYFRQAALSDVRSYLAALALFDERDLTLPQSEYDRIDAEMEDHLAAAGSKSALDADLASFGVNAKMLREIYVMEAKIEYVRPGDMRSVFATLHGEAGTPDSLVSLAMGHADGGSTKARNYQQRTRRGLIVAADSLSDYLSDEHGETVEN